MLIHNVTEKGVIDLSPSKINTIDILPQKYVDDYSIFDDPKEYVKWIYRIEKMFRDTIEYKDKLVPFIKKNITGMDTCGIHPNIHTWNGFTIELHHHPYKLYDLTVIVVNRRKMEHLSLKMTDIVDELLEIHGLGLVGFYPLCQMCHDYYHSDEDDKFYIPSQYVYGYPKKFEEIYEEYFTPSMRVKRDNIHVLDKSYELIQAHAPEALYKEYVYVTPFDREFGGEVIDTTKFIKFINTLGA